MCAVNIKCLEDLGVENFINYVAVEILELLSNTAFTELSQSNQNTIDVVENYLSDCLRLYRTNKLSKICDSHALNLIKWIIEPIPTKQQIDNVKRALESFLSVYKLSRF